MDRPNENESPDPQRDITGAAGVSALPGHNRSQDALVREVAQLRQEVARLNAHRFVAIHDNLIRLGAFQFYRGLAFGLGSVVGATLLVSLLVYLLSQIDFIPIIGEWANEIADMIRSPGGPRP